MAMAAPTLLAAPPERDACKEFRAEESLHAFVAQALDEVRQTHRQFSPTELDRRLAEALAKFPAGAVPEALKSACARLRQGAEPSRGLPAEAAEQQEQEQGQGQEFEQRARLQPSVEEDRVLLVRALRNAKGHPDVNEGDGSPMKCVTQQFRNWGRTVQAAPSVTFLPKSKLGVCNVVKWASQQGLKVRAAGYRHSWSSLFAGDGQVLISLLPLDVVEELPAKEPPIDPNNELQGIELVGEVEEQGSKKALCKIGAATTNEQFRRWVIDNSFDKATKSWRPWWTVPLNVIMVEITWGGSNGPICHGAGWKNQTLSDLVRSIELVNANGELQVVSNPDQLRAAAGCFGMLGVVTSLTLALDVLTFANMRPTREPVALAIPPPVGMQVPKNIDMSGITDADLRNAFDQFVQHCEKDYYAEWFWFVLQDKVWVNCWDNDGSPDSAVDYPSEVEVWVQEASGFVAQLLNMCLWPLLPASWQAHAMGAAGLLALPDGEVVVTPLIDGLHFRRGIQNMRVYDMEWEIPIPGKAEDPSQPDWSICQEAWWAVISAFYARYNADENDVPFRLTLEMRIMADSDVCMAPQFGNRHGTASIEILTPGNVDPGEFLGFMQAVTDSWLELKGIDGSYLSSRPHWAKQWQGLQVRGQDINSYLRQAYAAQLPRFASGLSAVASAGGFSMQQAKALFSNDLLVDLFGSVYDGELPAAEVDAGSIAPRCWWCC